MTHKIFNFKYMACITAFILFSFLHWADLYAGSFWLEPDVKNSLKRIPRLNAFQALSLFKSGRLIIIDTHEHMKQGEKSPIVGALTLPYPKIDKVRLKIPKNRIIACFCH